MGTPCHYNKDFMAHGGRINLVPMYVQKQRVIIEHKNDDF